MPIYEYACRACGTRFERLVRAFGEAVSCPSCAGAAVEKLLSRFALAGGGGGAAEPASAAGGCCGGGCGCGS